MPTGFFIKENDMINTLKLVNPIMIDGKEVAELTYDADEITSMQFIEAEGRALEYMGTGRVGAIEMDAGHQLYLGMFAIVAVNPNIDIRDLERIKGKDLIKVMRIGRNFTVPSEGSEEESSVQQYETTQKHLAPQQQTSEDGE